MNSVTATAPGKIILFGEHAINRGQPALAAAVGLYARCTVREAEAFTFRAGKRIEETSREAILDLAARIETFRVAKNFDEIRKVAADYFAPQKYILSACLQASLPKGLDLAWESELPSSSGLGSGGAAYVAMVKALNGKAEWAQLGDIVAHGGIASGLDTQTSFHGGVIHYTPDNGARPIKSAEGLSIVIGNTRMPAATSEVNTRVREWLAADPSRMHYFDTIGALTRMAIPLLERGDWPELGRLFTLNQLVLERIGVSNTQIDGMIEAALAAGALGAKLSGSGGGGIIIALTTPQKRQAVAEAINAAGGEALMPAIGVEGAHRI